MLCHAKKPITNVCVEDVLRLATLLTVLGPIWVYHVVSPAIGAMHAQIAGFTPATPQLTTP